MGKATIAAVAFAALSACGGADLSMLPADQRPEHATLVAACASGRLEPWEYEAARCSEVLDAEH